MFEILEVLWMLLVALGAVVSATLNSVFGASVAGAVAGAFGGAWAAQRIADRSKTRDELLKEIRSTNVAILLAWEVCNTFLSLKRQLVLPLKKHYDEAHAAFLDGQRRRAAGERGVVEIHMDLQTIEMPHVPIALLHAQLFEKINLSGRPLALGPVLTRSIENLERSLRLRNGLVITYQAKQNEWSHGDKLARYLGLPFGEGHVDLNYPNAVAAIATQTDDGIFFSRLMCDDLVEHGKTLAARSDKAFGADRPKISEADWTDATDLFPPEKEYESFLKGFKKSQAPAPTTWRAKLKEKFRR